MKANHRRVDQALKLRDLTAGEAETLLNMGGVTAWRWLQRLVADGHAHVCATRLAPRGGPPISVYRTGPMPEGFKIKHQKARTPKQRVDKYRKKMRETGDWEDRLAKQREYYWRTKRVGRDSLTAALFGDAP